MSIQKRGKHWHMDVTVNGVRYREALHTTDHREASALSKKRIGEIQQGHGASKAGKDFARLPFPKAHEVYCEERKPHVAERTIQLYQERGRRLIEYFGDTPLVRIKATAIAAYQAKRLQSVKNRTVNMEVTLLRLMLNRAKLWRALAEDVQMLPEGKAVVGRALTAEQKRLLFQTASTRDGWMVAFCAGVVAVSTTCRGVEVRNLRWRDVNLFDRVLYVRRSKNESGHRSIPLNRDAVAALGRLWDRAQALGSSAPDHFVFPACEAYRNGRHGKKGPQINPTRPQKGWRTAWRALVAETARQAGRKAANVVILDRGGFRKTIAAYRAAVAVFHGFRFHDLRHQAITELAEAGASDATLMAVAGHLTREMMEHYSHVRMAAKRTAVDTLESGLMVSESAQPEEAHNGTIQ